MKKYLSVLISLTFLTLNFSFNNKRVKAQVSADTTLPNPTQVTPTTQGVEINGGTTRGNNLFHSFTDFSVPTGTEAFFNNNSQIVNILNRVTGGNVSSIDGLIRANGSANFFLINPAGIIFGENAQLNLGGSFFASTADTLLFDDGIEFSATNPENSATLTINAPIGLNFRDNPGNITVNNSNLQIAPGKILSLTGGNVSINGGGLLAPGGRIELGGLSAVGEIGISSDSSLTFPDGVVRSDVSLGNGASVDVAADNGGTININAKDLTLTGASILNAGIESGLGNLEAQAGNINLNTTGEISLRQSSKVFNRVNENAIGNSGNINIQTDSLTVLEESSLSASAFGLGNAGDITINATNELVFGELTGAFSIVDIEGDSGNINVTANNISLTNGAQLSTATFGEGNAGNIVVNALDSISLDGEAQDGSVSGFTAEITSEGIGNGGNINVTTNNLSVTNGARLSSLNNGQGEAGNIIVNASDSISLNGQSQAGFDSGFYTEVQQGAIGNAGKIEVNTGSLTISNNANLTTTSRGQGNAGNILINATNGVTLNQEGSIDASIALGGQGNAGEITINAGKNIALDGFLTGITANLVLATGEGGKIKITGESLSLANNAFINASNNLSQGAGGNIQIDVTDSISLQEGASIASNSSGIGGEAGNITIQAGGNVVLEGSSIFAPSSISTSTSTSSKGGDINITSNSLILNNYSQIFASTFGEGNAGNINVEVFDSVTGNGTLSFLSSLTNGAGNAGDVTIKAGKNLSFDGVGSGVNTGTFSSGQGGDINLTTDSLTLSNRAALLTSTIGEGNAGNIKVNTDSISLNSSAQIDSSTSAQGNAGNIQVNASDSVVLNENTRLRSAAFPESVGKAGNVEVKTDSLFVNKNAQVTVESNGQGNGGNLFIQADSLNLEDNALLNASTFSGEGGNIILQIGKFLFLKDNSTISAEAFNNANGGNLTIDARFIIAFPNQNNDIVANAAQGRGGNIDITTEGIFGIEERPLNPFTNDINASSQFGLDGEITLNLINTDIFQETAELPRKIVEIDNRLVAK